MHPIRLLGFLLVALLLTSGVTGQEKKEDSSSKVRGQLPLYWGQIGLTDDQKQKVYKVQAKYNDEIEKLESKIRDLREKMKKDRYEILSPDQQKKLEEVIKSKAGGGKTEK